MATQPRNWNFETPNVNNLMAPLQQGIRDYRAQEQQGIENRRADEQLGFQRQRFGMEQQKFEEDKAQKVRERAGNLALAALSLDDNTRAQKWPEFIKTHPNAAGLDPSYHDPRTGPLKILADAGMSQNLLDWQLKKAAEGRAAAADGRAAAADGRSAALHPQQLTALQNQNAQYENMAPAQRIQAAPTLFPPDEIAQRSGPYRQFIATGKYDKGENKALEAATAKTAVELAEADIRAGYGAQEVQASTAKLRELMKDRGINAAIGPVMGSPTAQSVGGLIPYSQTFGITNPKLNQQIEQVKNSIVLSVQQKMKGMGAQSDSDAARIEAAVGALNKARNVQEMNNAVNEIDRTVAIAMARAQAAARQFPTLGSRLNVGAPVQNQPADRLPSAQQAVQEARDALARGAPRDAVLKRLRENGIDASGL